jgi:hypothetical protein
MVKSKEIPKAKTKEIKMTVSQEMKRDESNQRMENAIHNNSSKNKYAGWFQCAHLVWWILCIGGMICTHVIAHADGPVRHILPLDILALKVFGTRDNLKVIFNLACLAHVFEAQYAIYVCTFQLGLTDSWPLWGIQTVLLGYPSLSLLLKRRTELDLIYTAKQAENKEK